MSVPQREALDLYLALIAGNALADEYLEIRAPKNSLSRQRFVPVRDRDEAADAILRAAERADTYTGAAPRTRKAGTADAVAQAWCAWVDCDNPDAVRALVQFRPKPSIVVRSGGITDRVPHVHALWSIPAGIASDALEDANRRLAARLNADPRCYDAARVLRPPGTLSHKHGRVPVVCTYVDALAYYTLDELLENAPALRVEPSRPAQPITLRDRLDDPLHSIEPAEYVPLLTGREIGHDGKVRCPFHNGGDERTPSFHVYADHWFCFGCDRGGSIIDLGAMLYRLEPRGVGFHEIRRRLAADLLRADEAVAA